MISTHLQSYREILRHISIQLVDQAEKNSTDTKIEHMVNKLYMYIIPYLTVRKHIFSNEELIFNTN